MLVASKTPGTPCCWALGGEPMVPMVPGLWREAVGMLRDMERNGVSPDVITYNAAIMALSRNKRWKEVGSPGPPGLELGVSHAESRHG